MSEHLVAPDDVRAVDDDALAHLRAARAEEEAGKARKTYLGEVDKAVDAIERRRELLGLVAGYRRLKADLGLMDFSDQIELGARLAEQFPDVGAREREAFRVVLLDEYQDTSVAQARMLGRLFSGDDPASGRGHAVTAVGDPNQAIYGWRGASVSNILGFAETFPAAAGGEVGLHRLTVNRRSQRRVLDVANRLAAPLLEAHPQVLPLEAPETAGAGVVEAHVHATSAEELAWLVDEVRSASAPTWADVGVLVRDNAHAAAVFDALTAAGVPVEIVGLSGLLRLPEVAEVVASLRLMHDVTDNAALLTLLTGPRWALGPRDLRLLARRADELSGRRPGGDDREADIAAALASIAEGVDPAELPALADALEDPGDADLSPAARERCALLADELRLLRRHVGEPLLDVVRRVVELSGVDVELASALTPAAASRRDNLDLFVRAVADFQAVDGDTTLPALLAYLTAEEQEGGGLDQATPSEQDSVKLLTVHRSKGLEWHTVFCVGTCETRFPSNRSRSLWTSSPSVLPAPLRGDAADLPQLEGWDKPALDAYRQRTREHDATEELRLGYVAFTRAAERLVVSSFCWGDRPTPFGPSGYQRLVRDLLVEWGEPPARWLERPDPKQEANPLLADDPAVPWPRVGRGQEVERRLEAAERVRARMAALPDDAPPSPDDEPGVETVDDAAVVAEWDEAVDRLLAEARLEEAPVRDVPLPSSLSATALARLRDDPAGLAADLARPMPRRPSPQARFGTRFHAWVESRLGQQGLFADVDVPGRGDAGIADDADLRAVVASFESGPFADRPPHAVEAPFALVLRGQVVRGRIDAVYAETWPDGGPGWLVVDWKTGHREDADPLQLAVYRVAWAELAGVPPERVRAAFHHVRSGRTEEPRDLPDRARLEALLGGPASGAAD